MLNNHLIIGTNKLEIKKFMHNIENIGILKIYDFYYFFFFFAVFLTASVTAVPIAAPRPAAINAALSG